MVVRMLWEGGERAGIRHVQRRGLEERYGMGGRALAFIIQLDTKTLELTPTGFVAHYNNL